jgi:glucose/arabinose dehydrogenase
MLASRAYKIVMASFVVLIVAVIVVTSAENRSKAAAVGIAAPAALAAPSSCPSDDTGLKLPTGFCATIFAEGVGHTRHIVVAPDGTVYANTWSGEYFGNDKTHEGGFLVAMQDKSGAGKADTIERFGGTEQTGDKGGTGIGIYNGSLYAETNDKIVKYALTPGSITPSG